MACATVVAGLEPEAHFRRFTEHGVRPDGRGFTNTRAMAVSHEPLRRAELSQSAVAGSSLISLGGTRVLASVTLQVGVPGLAAPSDGEVEVAVQFAPCSSRDGSAGSKQPGERATVMGETFRDLIVKAGVVQLSNLCIEQRACAW